jgi:hypothetical protein
MSSSKRLRSAALWLSARWFASVSCWLSCVTWSEKLDSTSLAVVSAAWRWPISPSRSVCVESADCLAPASAVRSAATASPA